MIKGWRGYFLTPQRKASLVRPRYGGKYIFKTVIEDKGYERETGFCISQKEITVGPSEHGNATFNFIKVVGI
jgi:hypothetical protein